MWWALLVIHTSFWSSTVTSTPVAFYRSEQDCNEARTAIEPAYNDGFNKYVCNQVKQ